jgi:hypothetical protein
MPVRWRGADAVSRVLRRSVDKRFGVARPRGSGWTGWCASAGAPGSEKECRVDEFLEFATLAINNACESPVENRRRRFSVYPVFRSCCSGSAQPSFEFSQVSILRFAADLGSFAGKSVVGFATAIRYCSAPIEIGCTH